MEHLQSYNEGLFNWRRKKGKKPLLRGFKKNDIYLTKIKHEKRVGPSELSDDKTFYAIIFPEMRLSMIKKHVIGRIWDFTYSGKCVFSNDYSKPSLARVDDIRNTSTWFDVGDTFISLRKISNGLGYKLNETVYNKIKQRDSKIVEIVNAAFYQDGFASNYIDYCFTLLYKLEDDESYYQIGQLELIDNDDEKNIVDEVIEENFLELMDDGLISFTSQEITIKGVVNYKCLIKVSKDMTPQILFKISECLLVATQRLNDMNIDIDIKSMKHSEDSNTRTGTTDIEFTAIQR
jgi:hypothetical protein